MFAGCRMAQRVQDEANNEVIADSCAACCWRRNLSLIFYGDGRCPWSEINSGIKCGRRWLGIPSRFLVVTGVHAQFASDSVTLWNGVTFCRRGGIQARNSLVR